MKFDAIYSDIAPMQGRRGQGQLPQQTELVWQGTCFSMWGELTSDRPDGEQVIKLQGNLRHQWRLGPSPGWIELETSPGHEKASIEDLYLVGTRPLPRTDLTCICRHPLSRDYLLAGTANRQLLLMDANITKDLSILRQHRLPGPLSSLVCCGEDLLGLERLSATKSRLHLISLTEHYIGSPICRTIQTQELPQGLIALAENDCNSAWGVSDAGELFQLEMGTASPPGSAPYDVESCGVLGGRTLADTLKTAASEVYQAIRARRLSWRQVHFRPGTCSGLAFDGSHFWSFFKDRNQILRVHNQKGTLIRSYSCHSGVSLSSINYCHNNLIVLDQPHQRLHLYHLADTMQPVASLQPLNRCNPGYLASGSHKTAGMHELCLLYVGGEGTQAVHRYEPDKLLPLLSYLSPEGQPRDYFIGGFLMLAQYSPLLNGRGFGLDLPGPPSRKEDWLALFDEYFYPQANLAAMDSCLENLAGHLPSDPVVPVKVVLSIPTADPRCLDWDDSGYSLDVEAHRLEVTRWAMQELLKRWHQAGYRHLQLVGFFYMTEQGAYNDGLLRTFPLMCRELGLSSFAIPGITSAWITEFSRAGFDGIALQPSHSFWQPAMRPRYYLLKCAGRIAREYGMGMEVELPYDVLEPAGRQKLRDYLDMAAIQGWAGTFTAFFQSYNLIKSLCESQEQECRQLYDDLYRFTRLSRQHHTPNSLADNMLPFNCQAAWEAAGRTSRYRLNIEAHQGVFHLKELYVE